MRFRAETRVEFGAGAASLPVQPAYEPAAVPGRPGRRMAGDRRYCVPQLVQRLLGAAVVWFPYADGRQPKGGVKKPGALPGGRTLLDDRPDATGCASGLSPDTPASLCWLDTSLVGGCNVYVSWRAGPKSSPCRRKPGADGTRPAAYAGRTRSRSGVMCNA